MGFIDKIKRWLGFEKAQGKADGVKDIDLYIKNGPMQNAYADWMRMYDGARSDNRKNLKLASRIASEISRLVCLEAEFGILGENERAEFLREQFGEFLPKLRTYVEYAAAGGGIMFKPYVTPEGGVAVSAVRADMFRPIGCDSSGHITSAVFFETKAVGENTYLRVEKHLETRSESGAGRAYVITNLAYRLCGTGVGINGIGSLSGMGASPVPLGDIPEWADIKPEVCVDGLSEPLFSYFRMPFGNTVDRTSPLGVSVYARAADLISDADCQYDLYLWEFDGGALAIDAAEDALCLDDEGNHAIPAGRERLYRKNKLSVDDGGKTDLFKTFSPELRDSSYAAGLEKILRQVEHTCGLAYGTLSEVNETAKTATEIRNSRQRSYSTVTEIQKSLQDALERLVSAADELCTLYDLAPAGEYTTSAIWDDSIINDPEAERMRDMQEVGDGIMAKWEYRVKWYGEDEQTAKKRISEQDMSSDSDLLQFD